MKINYSNKTIEEFERELHCSHTNVDEITSWLLETLREKEVIEKENAELKKRLIAQVEMRLHKEDQLERMVIIAQEVRK